MTFDFAHLINPISITRAAVSIALAGSIWAMTAGKRCSTCQMASGMTGGLKLGRIGTAIYLVILFLTFLPRSTPSAWALAAAVGSHLVLASLLLKNRMICRNCFLIATAAVVGSASAILADPSHNLSSLFAVPLGGVATFVAIGISASAAARRGMLLAERLLAEAVNENAPVASGTVKIIVLYKPQCFACEFFKKSVLPELEKQFGGRMEVEHREAAPGTPAPTLLILGKTPQHFIGAAPAEAIAPTILMALGEIVVLQAEQDQATGALAVAI